MNPLFQYSIIQYPGWVEDIAIAGIVEKIWLSGEERVFQKPLGKILTMDPLLDRYEI